MADTSSPVASFGEMWGLCLLDSLVGWGDNRGSAKTLLATTLALG